LYDAPKPIKLSIVQSEGDAEYRKSVRKALKALSIKSRTQAEIIKAYEEQIKRYRNGK